MLNFKWTFEHRNVKLWTFASVLNGNVHYYCIFHHDYMNISWLLEKPTTGFYDRHLCVCFLCSRCFMNVWWLWIFDSHFFCCINLISVIFLYLAFVHCGFMVYKWFTKKNQSKYTKTLTSYGNGRFFLFLFVHSMAQRYTRLSLYIRLIKFLISFVLRSIEFIDFIVSWNNSNDLRKKIV